jgi:hypothetical protein
MKYYLYCSSGNTGGIDEYVAFLEIADDGYCSRYLEIQHLGKVLKYTEEKPADEFGALPEKPWDVLEASKPEYGVLNEISLELFESAWSNVRAA